MATVVVVLSWTWLRSSIPADADVITASVRSGLISDTAPTNVVLPTPKPPATTILAEVVDHTDCAPYAGCGCDVELPKSTEHPLKQCHIRLAARLAAARLVDGDHTGLGEVGHEDPGHAERDGEQCGDLGHRLDLARQMADPLVFRQQSRVLTRVGGRADHGLYGELVARPGAATGHGVRPNQRLVAFHPVRRVVGRAVRARRSGWRGHEVLRVRAVLSRCGKYGTTTSVRELGTVSVH